MTNNNLFADRLLNGKLPLNVYSLFDLANLAEAILLSSRIVTLPGRGLGNDTANRLRRAGILGEFQTDEDSEKAINLVRGNWTYDFLNEKDLDKLAIILQDIFGADQELAK